MTPRADRSSLRELWRDADARDDAFGLILVVVIAVMGMVLFVAALAFVALLVWMVLHVA